MAKNKPMQVKTGRSSRKLAKMLARWTQRQTPKRKARPVMKATPHPHWPKMIPGTMLML